MTVECTTEPRAALSAALATVLRDSLLLDGSSRAPTRSRPGFCNFRTFGTGHWNPKNLPTRSTRPYSQLFLLTNYKLLGKSVGSRIQVGDWPVRSNSSPQEQPGMDLERGKRE
jgi:hypothetical protein